MSPVGKFYCAAKTRTAQAVAGAREEIISFNRDRAAATVGRTSTLRGRSFRRIIVKGNHYYYYYTTRPPRPCNGAKKKERETTTVVTCRRRTNPVSVTDRINA